MEQRCEYVESIAMQLWGLPSDMQLRLLTHAFTKVQQDRPHIAPELFRPWAQQMLMEIRQRLDELEQTGGHA
jgi:hypothetical protein